MVRKLLRASLVMLLLSACSGTEGQSGDVHGDSWWTGGQHDLLDDAGGPADSVTGDAACPQPPCADAAPGDARGPDSAYPHDTAVNTPPEIAKLSPISLDQGKSTTLDLNPFLSDGQDPDEALLVSWSAKEVALQDPGDHVLYIVAPTTWFGAEMIPITVTDTAGLQATTDLKVIVQEVTVIAPPPPVECPKTPFSLDAGKSAKQVLLSGNFNNWGADDKSAEVMGDPDGDGVFEVEIELAPGTYQYKFIVDGNWMTDPKNPKQVDDGYGGQNSVVTVPECEK